MKVTVKAYMDGQEVVSKILEPGVYRVGRSEFCDIVLNGQSVSRSHLEIRVSESAVYMTNMSSAGKVFLNGAPLETGEIADGDELKLGPFRLVVFHSERQPEPGADGGAADGDADAQGEPGAEEEGGFGDAGDMGAEPNDMGGGFDAGGGFGEEGLGDGGLDGGADPGEDALGGDAMGAEDGGLGGDFGDDGVGGGGFGDDGGFGQMEDEGGAPAPALSAEPEYRADGTELSRAETQVEIKPIVAKLMFTEGPRAGEEMFIETFEVTLGRSKKADIYIDDEKLSRIHAKITRVGMGYRLIDQNSRNGTYVNGMRILEHPLNSFDEIELGNSKIKFLIHDIMASEMQKANALASLNTGTAAVAAAEQTRSVHMEQLSDSVLLELQQQGIEAGGVPPVDYSGEFALPADEPLFKEGPAAGNKNKILIGAIAALVAVFVLLPGDPPADQQATPTTVTESQSKPIQLPPSLPKEYAELNEDEQRQMEGFYNAAIQSADQGALEDAVAYLRRIHNALPYYKDSQDLQVKYLKQVREKQTAEAKRRAKEDEKQDLAIYLEEGLDYLKAGDFGRAAEAFNSAIVIDPNNPTAVKGLKAAEAKVTSLDAIPAEQDEEKEKRKLVSELFQRAVTAFTNKAYQEAIETAENIKKIELVGDTQYLNEAQQIIDRARMLQKEEFEPFLIQAKEKYAEGDYNSSRDLCEEMLKRDPAYDEANECVRRAKRQLNRLAKEAYTYGYILESMNRIEEAKQYWNRARNYVRRGDNYFDKVMKKLDYYE